MSRLKKRHDIEGLNELVENVAYKLKQLREKAGLSQKELSRRSKVGQSTINEIENRQVNDLQLSTVLRLANEMDVHFIELFSESDLKLTDPDKRELVKAVEEIEKHSRTLQRLKTRLQ